MILTLYHIILVVTYRIPGLGGERVGSGGVSFCVAGVAECACTIVCCGVLD